MNKKVIFTGLGVAALAAMPLLGVYADGAIQRTDHLTVTIDKGCTFTAEATDGVDNAVILAQGAAIQDIKGVEFNITCPSAVGDSTWELQAGGLNGSNKLSSAAGSIDSGTSLDGSASNWAFKLETTGAVKLEETYDKYAAVPAKSTKVASGNGTEGNASIKALYGVSASSSQEPGTYTGGVTYTLTSTAAE